MYKYCTSDNYYNSSVSDRMKILMQVQGVLFCPISRKSDQHLFSPNNIITSSREKVMRINKIITSGKIHVLWSFIKFSQRILEGSVWRSVWRICIWILESKKLRQSNWFNGHTVYTVYSKNRNTYDFSSIKRVTRKFLDVSRCSRSKQQQRKVFKKCAAHKEKKRETNCDPSPV